MKEHLAQGYTQLFQNWWCSPDLPTKLIEDIHKFCLSFPKIIDDWKIYLLTIEFLKEMLKLASGNKRL